MKRSGPAHDVIVLDLMLPGMRGRANSASI